MQENKIANIRSKFTKKRVIVGILLLIIVFLIGSKVFGSGEKGEMITATRSSIVKEVLVAGKTKARQEVDLGFDKSGRVSRVYADIGDRVVQGQVIAELDAGTELANIAKEEATLLESEANIGIDSAKLASLIREGYRAADNAIRNKTDQFFKTPRTNPVFEVKFNDGNFVHYFNVPGDLVYELNNTRRDLETMLNNWQAELSYLNEYSSQNYSSIATDRLSKVNDFLNKIAYAVNQFTPSEFQYESTVEGYKTNINSARSEVTSAQEAIIAASSGTANTAKVNQIKASIAASRAELRRSKITAPFSGVVTRQDAKLGSIVGANSEVVSLISDNDMYIEADVSEVNIGKIAIDNEVLIEFDALPEAVYRGYVSYIEPAETLIDGVVNYKIRVELNASNTPLMMEQVRSGLTANLKVETAKIENVLSVPNFAVIERDGKKYVNKVVDAKTVVETEIETGLVGSDGLIEIKSGLNEGDTIEFKQI